VAVLVGPDAPLVIDMKTRASHACDVWDFFKPDMSSEYPRVGSFRPGLVFSISLVIGPVAAHALPSFALVSCGGFYGVWAFIVPGGCAALHAGRLAVRVKRGVGGVGSTHHCLTSFRSFLLLPSTPPDLTTFSFSALAAPRRAKVNGQLSQTCYLRALDSCYDRLAAKKSKQGAGDGGDGGGKGRPFVLGDVEHVLCHSPYNKLVQKSFARMAFSDARRLRKDGLALGEGQEEALGKWLDVPADVRALSCDDPCLFLFARALCVSSLWNGFITWPMKFVRRSGVGWRSTVLPPEADSRSSIAADQTQHSPRRR